ncbi:MAG: hypothetical protein WBD20_23075, partial [Pirellulaceae bacterium]
MNKCAKAIGIAEGHNRRTACRARYWYRWTLIATVLYLATALVTSLGQAQDTPNGDNSNQSDTSDENSVPAGGNDGARVNAVELKAQAILQKEAKERQNDQVRLPIPARLPDGRPINAIGVFQSQIVNVVPADYQPVSIERLSDAIGLIDQKLSGSEDFLLKSSFYDVRLVGDTLVSDHSAIDIQFRHQGNVTRSLGSANIALTNELNGELATQINPASGVSIQLESTANGELLAKLQSTDNSMHDATLDFSWQKRGKRQGIYQTFDLELPQTAQTRVVLSTPVDTMPETTDGVLQNLPGPPPGADVDSRADNVRWHSIDAGGLKRIRIRMRPVVDKEQTTPVLIRGQSRRYEIDSVGLSWQHAITLQAPGGRTLPDFHVANGSVTAVKVDNVSIQFDQTTNRRGGRTIRIQPALSGPASVLSTANVTITGTATWDNSEGWCSLPCVTWNDQSVLLAHPSIDARVVLRDPLDIVAWELPPQWTQQPVQAVDADADLGGIVVSAEGPAISIRSSGADETEVEEFTIANPLPTANEEAREQDRFDWSRIRIATRPAVVSQDAFAQFVVGDEPVNADRIVSAKVRFDLAVESAQTSPIELHLEQSWNLSNIKFIGSGRQIEPNAFSQRGRVITIWPETDDLEDSRLTIQCEGFRRVTGTSQRLDLPEMWFIRMPLMLANPLTLIAPPDDLHWTGETALRGIRLTKESLSDQQLRFFDGITENALLYQPRTNVTPSLSLIRPVVLIDVRTSLKFERMDNEVHESLAISADANSQLIKQFSIQTGPPNETEGQARPNYRWSLHAFDSELPINLPPTAVSISDDGVYTIDLGDASLRNRILRGRRQYPLDRRLTVTLPSAIGAASQEAEIIIGSGLELTHRDPSVQRVPMSTPANLETSADVVSLSSSGSFPPSSGFNESESIRLRYNPVKNSRIVISKLQADPNVSLIWQHQISLTASSRGTDSIRGLFKVSAKRPIKIQYEPNMRLVSLTHNNTSIDLATIAERPIVLSPQNDIDTIRAVWTRESLPRGWLRRCQIPKIQMEGVQIESSYRMTASADTFALASFLDSPTEKTGVGIDVISSRLKLLIHRDYALAAGWLLSLILFSLAWMFARRHLLALSALIAIATVSAVLWWPWQAAIIGWIVLPMVAAALLESTLQWNRSDRPPAGQRISDNESHSTEFSVTAAKAPSKRAAAGASIVLVFGSAACCWTSSGHAQESLKRKDAVNVLVPIGQQESRVGDKVYIPNSVYQELFDANDADAPSDVTFLSANYRVDLESIRKSVETGGVLSVEADFTIRVNGASQVARLPLAARQLRRIEVRQGELTRIVRFSADEQGGVLASLPQGDRFQISVVMIPSLSSLDGVNELQLAIPAIASARLLVESDRSVENVNVIESEGAVAIDRALRRWEANLGPVNTLRVQYSPASESGTAATPEIERRYHVNIGKTMTFIDCQVELRSDLKVGDETQFIVLDSNVPTVTSAVWRIERADLISPSRHRITVTKLADIDAPLQLFWSRPSIVNDATSLQDRTPMGLPDVIPISSKPFHPAWLAIEHDPGIRVTRIDQGNTQELTASKFFAKWQGYRSTTPPAQLFVATDALPLLVALQSQAVEANAEVSHELHVGTKNAELNFLATIKPSDSFIQRRTLRVPRNLQVSRLTANGEPIVHTGKEYDDYLELSLGEFGGVTPVTIEATGVMRIPRSKLFALPEITIWPEIEATTAYTVTRDADATVDVVHAPRATKMTLSTEQQKAILNEGRIFVGHWHGNQYGDQTATIDKRLPGRIGVKPKPADFRCSQMIEMNYASSRWNMSSTITFDNGNVPDFVDLEIPTRWCDSLAVVPDLLWTRQDSTNESFQLIRIACDRQQLVDNKLIVESELNASDAGRVAVPRTQVLGLGKRSITVSLPNRLTTEPIRWDPRAVGPVKEVGSRSIYEADNDAWSIELAPMSDAKSDPVALAVDSEVLVQGDESLVITRWDLVPNGLDSVVVRLPPQATCLGAWTAGRSVAPQRVSPDQAEIIENEFSSPTNSGIAQPHQANEAIRVPLSLSRLAQSVEVLLRVPATQMRRGNYLPTLDRIAVPDQWVATFSPSQTGERPVDI